MKKWNGSAIYAWLSLICLNFVHNVEIQFTFTSTDISTSWQDKQLASLFFICEMAKLVSPK